MKKRLIQFCICILFLFLFSVVSHAAIITDENFESGAVGWSSNTTTTGPPVMTTFLGRFGNTGWSQDVYKTYALSGNQTQVEISFDFYEIDSWDTEYFVIFIDDVQVLSPWFRWGYDDGLHGLSKIFPGDDGYTNYGFNTYSDQGFHFHFIYNTTATSLKLGFGAALSSLIDDESWGIDNVYIIDDTAASAVPAPSAMILMGLGLLALSCISRKKGAAIF